MKSQNEVCAKYAKLSMKSSMKSFQKVLFSVKIKIEGETERPLLKDSLIQTHFPKIKFNEGSMKFQ